MVYLEKKRLYVTAGIWLASVVLAAVSWFTLPETVVVQINMQGAAGNTAPKIVGVLLPLLVSGVFSFLFYRFGDKRHLLLSAVGLVIGILLLAFNGVMG